MRYQDGVVSFKRLYYGSCGEPIQYGKHNLRYVPGTRPVRLKYVNSPNGTVRNDAKQISFFLEERVSKLETRSRWGTRGTVRGTFCFARFGCRSDHKFGRTNQQGRS